MYISVKCVVKAAHISDITVCYRMFSGGCEEPWHFRAKLNKINPPIIHSYFPHLSIVGQNPYKTWTFRWLHSLFCVHIPPFLSSLPFSLFNPFFLTFIHHLTIKKCYIFYPSQFHHTAFQNLSTSQGVPNGKPLNQLRSLVLVWVEVN